MPAPYLRGNRLPAYAGDDTILVFFFRIAEAVLSRR
jgi:hypothetical protein